MNTWNEKAIISRNIRFRQFHNIEIGDYSIIDDYCYISTKLKLGKFFHIASNCVIAGGKDSLFEAGDFGSLAAGTKVFCSSDDFINDISTCLPEEVNHVKDHLITGDVILNNFVTIGANSVVMPNNVFPEGCCVGANTFVKPKAHLEPWTVYATIDGKFTRVKRRNKDNILRQRDEILKILC